jgi:hypothetical protein
MKVDYSKCLGFIPVAPCPDTDELAERGERLILLIGKQAHMGISVGRETHDNTVLVAPKGLLSAGWVIGVETLNN